MIDPPIRQGWARPGQHADVTQPRYDLKRGWLKPDEGVTDRGLQWVGQGQGGFDPSKSDPAWHSVISPKGTPAPLGTTNYTPATGQVHAAGMQAPVNEDNVSLLPMDAFTFSQDMVGTGQMGSPLDTEQAPWSTAVGSGQSQDPYAEMDDLLAQVAPGQVGTGQTADEGPWDTNIRDASGNPIYATGDGTTYFPDGQGGMQPYNPQVKYNWATGQAIWGGRPVYTGGRTEPSLTQQAAPAAAGGGASTAGQAQIDEALALAQSGGQAVFRQDPNGNWRQWEPETIDPVTGKKGTFVPAPGMPQSAPKRPDTQILTVNGEVVEYDPIAKRIVNVLGKAGTSQADGPETWNERPFQAPNGRWVQQSSKGRMQDLASGQIVYSPPGYSATSATGAQGPVQPSEGQTIRPSTGLPPQRDAYAQPAPGPISHESQDAFVRSMLPYAVQVSQETGIPVSVLLAIPINEQGWQTPAPGNNYYGIKGKNPITGASTGPVGTWESEGGQRVNTTAEFRAYDSPADSMRDFAQFLTENSRYQPALAAFAKSGNPQDLLVGMNQAGYATDPDWAAKVGSIAGTISETLSLSPSAGGAIRAPSATTAGAPGGAGGFWESKPKTVVVRDAMGNNVLINEETGQIIKDLGGGLDPRDTPINVGGGRVIARNKEGGYGEVYKAPTTRSVQQAGGHVFTVDPETSETNVVYSEPGKPVIGAAGVFLPPDVGLKRHAWKDTQGGEHPEEIFGARQKTGWDLPDTVQRGPQKPGGWTNPQAASSSAPSITLPSEGTQPTPGDQGGFGLDDDDPYWQSLGKGQGPVRDDWKAPETLPDGWWNPPPSYGTDDPEFLRRLTYEQGTPAGDVDPPRVGGGQGAPIPPIDPQQIVGGGNKFGEQVSMEGTHMGTDLQAYEGTPVIAPVSGSVESVDSEPEGLGLTVSIRGSDGSVYTLAHLLSADVKPGDSVQQGQVVARVGESGKGATGPHLDYRIKDSAGAWKNPEPQLGQLGQLPEAPNTVPEGAGKGQGRWMGKGQDWPDFAEDFEIDPERLRRIQQEREYYGRPMQEYDYDHLRSTGQMGAYGPAAPAGGQVAPGGSSFRPIGPDNPMMPGGLGSDPSGDPSGSSFPRDLNDLGWDYDAGRPVNSPGVTNRAMQPNSRAYGNMPGLPQVGPQQWNTSTGQGWEAGKPDPSQYPDEDSWWAAYQQWSRQQQGQPVPQGLGFDQPYSENLEDPSLSMMNFPDFAEDINVDPRRVRQMQERMRGEQVGGTAPYDMVRGQMPSMPQGGNVGPQGWGAPEYGALGGYSRSPSDLASPWANQQNSSAEPQWANPNTQFPQGQPMGAPTYDHPPQQMPSMSAEHPAPQEQQPWQLDFPQMPQIPPELAAMGAAGLAGAGALAGRAGQMAGGLGNAATGLAGMLPRLLFDPEQMYGQPQVGLGQDVGKGAGEAEAGLTWDGNQWQDTGGSIYQQQGLQQEQQRIDNERNRNEQLANAENQRHQQAMATVRNEADRIREQARHDRAMEDLKEQELGLQKEEMQLKAYDSAMARNATYRTQGTFGQQQQAKLLQSALTNPWLQNLTGMAPGYGLPGWNAQAGGGVLQSLLQGWNPQATPDFSYLEGVPQGPKWLQQGTKKQGGQQGGGGGGGSQGGGAGSPMSAMMGGGNPSMATAAQAGYGGYAPLGSAPPTPDFQQWRGMSPFERASWRTLQESAQPFPAAVQQTREKWAGQGVFDTPDVAQFSAAAMSPLDTMGQNQTAEMFGEKPENYWKDQGKTWSSAAAPSISREF